VEWYFILLLVVGGFIALMLLGIPVFYSFFFVNIIAIYIIVGEVGLNQFVRSIALSLKSFSLLPIPAFILLGSIMFDSKISDNMIDTIDIWIGKIPGRLAILAVIAGAIMGTFSGAAMGTTAMLGSSLVPTMKEKGYHNIMSMGPILGSGGLAIMIPPTTLGVVLAITAKVSVGSMLIAIIVPGMLLALSYMLYIITICSIKPSLAPPFSTEKLTFMVKVLSLIKYVLPITLIIFLVIGLIFLGVASPTESAIIGVWGAVFLALLYRGFTFTVIKKSLSSTLKISVMVLSILAGSQAFSEVLAYSGVTRELSVFVAGLDVNPLGTVALMLLVILILGGFINGVPLILITIPIFIPIVEVLGFSKLWFGVMALLVIEMSATTPPYGILLYVMKSVAPKDTQMKDLIIGAFPFILCDAIVLLFLLFIPSLVLWLPKIMM